MKIYKVMKECPSYPNLKNCSDYFKIKKGEIIIKLDSVENPYQDQAEWRVYIPRMKVVAYIPPGYNKLNPKCIAEL